MPVRGLRLLDGDGFLKLGNFRVHHRSLGLVQRLGGAHFGQQILTLVRKLAFHARDFSLELRDRFLEQSRVALVRLAHALLFGFKLRLGLFDSLGLVGGL